MAEQSLKDKTIRGTAWSAAESVFRYGISFIVGIILARLLSPDEYGLIGILTIFITVFEIIIDGGFINALIRKQNAKDIDYCTVFYTNMALSFLMAGALFASSGVIARFFEREELIPLMQVMSPIVIINALSLVPKAKLTKELDFKTQTKVSVISALLSGVIGIVLAYKGYGVWALVAQQLTNAGLTTLLFWVLTRWMPKLVFSLESFREMWNFGWKLMLSGIFNSISGQLHQIVIGKVFSPASLGQYTRAFQFGNIFSGNLTSVIQRVTFPVLSEIQDDPVRLKDAYKRVIKVTVFPTFVLMFGLAAISKPLILVLIGEQWLDAAYMLQLLCFSMMLFPLHALNLNAIQVMGRSDLTLRINIIKNLLIAVPIVVGIITNIYWMLFADILRNIVCYYLNAYYSKPLLNYGVKEQVSDISPSLLVATIVSLPVYAVSFIPLSYYIILPIQILVGIVIFFMCREKIAVYEYYEIKTIILSFLRRR